MTVAYLVYQLQVHLGMQPVHERPGYKVSLSTALTEFRTQMIMLSGGVSYTNTLWNSVYPYATVHAGWINYQPMDVDGNELLRNKQNKYSPNEWFARAELGLKFMLSKSVAFSISSTMDYLPTDNLDDSPNSITGGSDRDIFFTLHRRCAVIPEWCKRH